MPPQRFVSTRFSQGYAAAHGLHANPDALALHTRIPQKLVLHDPTRTTTDINKHVNVDAEYADMELMQMEFMNDRTHRKSAPTT
jgi:hypothetical protein